MENIVRITQALENDQRFGTVGFVDDLDSQIRAVDGNLTALIDSPGGDIFKAASLSRTILEHKGTTKALVTGLAASASGLILVDFDEVEADFDARIMLHSAHVQGVDFKDLSESQQNEIKVFNSKAKRKLIAKGAANGIDNEILVNEIFNNTDGKDFWFSASEAKTRLGLVDTVTEVKRENGSPVIEKIAAYYESTKTKYNNYIMGIFNKKDESPIVARTAKLEDGRVIIFNSANDRLAKGDKVSLVGSNEPLTGVQKLEDGQEATFNAENEVEQIDLKAEIDPQLMEMFNEVASSLTSLEERVTSLEGGSDGKSSNSEDVQNQVKELKDEVAKLIDSIGKKQLVSAFKLPKVEGKKEAVFTGLSSEAAHIKGIREVLNAK